MERNFLLIIIVGCVIVLFSNVVCNVGKILLNLVVFVNFYENLNVWFLGEKYDLFLLIFFGNFFILGMVNFY